MEKKLTNSDPLREPADKHSIYKCPRWFSTEKQTNKIEQTGSV